MPEPRSLQPGDQMPFFVVDTLDGRTVRYSEVWQRKNVVLVCVPSAGDPASVRFVDELGRRAAEFDEYSAECVVTHDAVANLGCPAVVIADRWGEVQHLAPSAGLPSVQSLFDTLDYVQRRCPECEGEWR